MSKGRRIKNKKDNQKKHENEKNEKERNEELSTVIKTVSAPQTSNNLNLYFRIDELQELRKILDLNDLTDFSFILGAVILGKFDIVKKLLKDGHSINDNKTNNMTPIMWSIKNKNLEMVDLLLARGADITICDNNGDNALMLAVNSGKWDDQAFVDFWINIRQNNEINLNHTNKTGNTILHLAVKHQWINLVKLLIDSKVNVNCVNSNGITPLIIASIKNNAKIVKLLIKANANIHFEDRRSCTALCYAISYIIQNRLDPSISEIIDELIQIINSDDCELSADDYIKRRIDLIVISDAKSDFARIISTIVLSIFIFFIRHIQTGLEILLDLNVFLKLRDAIEKHIDSTDYVNAILLCIFEIVRYCKCCVGGGLSTINELQVNDLFILSGAADMCLCILKRYANSSNQNCLLIPALMPIFLTCVSEGKARIWLQLHYRVLLPFYQQFLEMCVVSFSFIADDYHIKMVKYKIRKFQTLMIQLQSYDNVNNLANQKSIKSSLELISPNKQYSDALSKGKKSNEINNLKDVIESDSQRKLITLDEYLSKQDNQKNDLKFNSKRMKRKTKAWKAKIAKLRSAVVAERVISKPDLLQEINSSKIDNIEQQCDSVIDWNIVDSIQSKNYSKKMIVENNFNNSITSIKLEHQESSSDGVVSEDENEERTIDLNSDSLNFSDDNLCNFNEEIENLLAPKIQYLLLLFEDIVARYERNWRTDKELGYPDYLGCQGDSCDSLLTGTREEQIRKLGEILPLLESLYLTRLREKFMEVLTRIKQIAYDRDIRYQQLIEQLQIILLKHEVRGESAQTNGVATRNYYEFIENAFSTKYWAKNINLINIDKYVKEKEEEYIKQMIILSKIKSNVCQEDIDVAKQKTEESAYHLIESVEKLLESSTSSSCKDDGSECEHNFDELFPYSSDNSNSIDDTVKKKCNNDQKTTNSQKTCANNFFNILSNGKSRRNVTKSNDDSPDNSSNYKYQQSSPVVLQQQTSNLNNVYWKKSQMSFPVPGQHHSYVSRWDSVITNLRNYKNLTVLACGELRTSPQSTRAHFMVSSGGNFGDVELGLDVHCRALAVKRVPKQNNVVCKILKAAMNPLLGLRHKHLLHYAVCEYDDTQLLIASPLCEYNMGEYLMCLKLNHTLLNTATNLARQMLIGLRYLHERTMPIVHGNLKPSNVLIDSCGVLKLAEFGVYRALYQTVRPPKSSIIWFARETYEHYEKTSIMSCTTYSDIQVAGMLLHFILTGGLHPFGIVAEDILDNIMRGSHDLKTTACELIDLISWMLIYEPSERPSVSQVLSHVYFWDSERKWRFLLACAGITQHGSPIPISLNHLHTSLDASAVRDHIKGDWVSVVKMKFPGIRLPEGSFSDTPTGLLRFLRACTEERQLNSRSFGGIDIQTFFIEAFPALPLSLFRLLETTDWLKHPAFAPFAIATN